MNCIEERNEGKYTIRIFPDEDPENPRKWNNLGTMICLHKKYTLGDQDNDTIALAREIEENCASWEAAEEFLEEQIRAMNDEIFVILPLYLFDHSGITISCSSYWFRQADSVGWDWGQVGFIFVTKKKARERFKRLTEKTREKIEEILRNEVEIYNQYLTGDVLGFVIYENNEVIESCWGYYNKDECINAALNTIEHLKH